LVYLRLPGFWDIEANGGGAIGTYNCIGKQVALMELRMVTAGLVNAFDVTLAPKEDGAELLGSKDQFTVATGPLSVLFTPKKSKKRRV
jgi:cytochrome P450